MLNGRRAMTPVRARRRAARPDAVGLTRVLPQIKALIEGARQQVVSTANLTQIQNIPQPAAVRSGSAETFPTPEAEPEGRLAIDFSKHSHRGWTHYRVYSRLLEQEGGAR